MSTPRKPRGGTEDIAPRNLDTRIWMVNLTPRPPYPR